MGDIVGLMKDFEEVVDAEKAEEDAVRMLKGKFDMQDFLEQIRVIQKMGSLKDLFEKMPFFSGGLPEGVNLDDKELVQDRGDDQLDDEAGARAPRGLRGDLLGDDHLAEGPGHAPSEAPRTTTTAA